ncbi:metallophosphoesterase, partial [Streptomyces calidiresistens]|nr:metallophosphoesterase [Streptomyces calidiresistens]
PPTARTLPLMPRPRSGRLTAVADLHVRYPENRALAESLRPERPDDWLLVAGDVGEYHEDVARTLRLLADRFRTVVWAPGNHELWTPRDDPDTSRGVERYHRLVTLCRELGIHTPEDPYPLWESGDGPVAIAPLFVLYDYTWRPPGARDRDHALEIAGKAGIMGTDEALLHPDPHAGRDAWCAERVAYTERRLAELPHDLPTVLVNHFPLIREPVRILRYPEFALWCGTDATADWAHRFRARAVVYGHLHIPRLIHADGVPHIEVSLGYPREWGPRPAPPRLPVEVPLAPAPANRGLPDTGRPDRRARTGPG